MNHNLSVTFLKSRTRETLNLLTDADIITIATKRNKLMKISKNKQKMGSLKKFFEGVKKNVCCSTIFYLFFCSLKNWSGSKKIVGRVPFFLRSKKNEGIKQNKFGGGSFFFAVHTFLEGPK